MAILARALINEFPDYQELFRIGAIQYGRRIMRNTNGLIGRYPGADGMKTGFICSAGFNVVASATRNGRHLITVVMGAPSANERTMKAAELFDRGFSSQATWSSPSLAALPSIGLDHASRYALGHLRPSAVPSPMRRIAPPPWRRSRAAASPNLFSSDMLAFAGGAQPLRTSLGPRSGGAARARVGRLEPAFRERGCGGGRQGSRKGGRKGARGQISKVEKQECQRQEIDADTVAETDDKPEVDKVGKQGQGSRHDQREAGDRQGEEHL